MEENINGLLLESLRSHKPKDHLKFHRVRAIEFKNPLNEAVEVNVRFDNPNFSAGKVNNKIEAKKVMNVPIAYKQISNDYGNTGRCIITINKLPPWVYYLSAE